MKKIILAFCLMILISENALSQTMCEGKTIRSCPKSALYQGKSIALAAVFYAQGNPRTQELPMISCNYGPKPDGSYKVYKNYTCCMPQNMKTNWVPVPGLIGQFQCDAQNLSKQCTYTISSASDC